MSKRSIPARDFLKGIQDVREADLSVYDCPMCKKSGTWIYDGYTNYILARAANKGELTETGLESELVGQVGDMVTRADCSNCGFVALFRRGLGPS